MRFLLVLFLLLTVGAAKVRADTPSPKALNEALSAYEDSRALYHKADSFLHARRAYFIALKLFNDSPQDLAPIIHIYANAAARYREPIALEKYQQALNLMVEVFGRESPKLIPLLVDAGEEAISRREPEMAYAWINRARKLLKTHQPEGSFTEARVQLALARLYFDSDERERAELRARRALELCEQFADEMSYPLNAQHYFWHGQIMRRLGRHADAAPSYQKALDIYLATEPKARPVLSIHKHMVEVSYHMGREQQLIEHCVAAQQYETARGMALYWPIFDPKGRLGQVDKVKTGQILAGFTRTPDCRAVDIVVHKTLGISAEEARHLLLQAYIPPRIRHGKIVADQKVDQMVINVY